MNNIRVAMCDDTECLCVNIKNQLKYVEDMEFVGYTTDSGACVELVQNTRPDVLLLDIQMENRNSGIDILPQLLEAAPGTKIIMLTNYVDSTYIFNSLSIGAADYVEKTCSNEELFSKIRAVYNNENTIKPEIFNAFKQKTQTLATAHKSLMFAFSRMITLSATELEVLKALYDGLTYNDIAKMRTTENTTVRSMGSRILRKFGVTSMRELIESLREMKIFDLFPDL